MYHKVNEILRHSPGLRLGAPTYSAAKKQAVYTLGLLHAELAGKLLANKREAIRLRTAMMQVEAVVKMLEPGFNVASIAAKRRNKSNPWFKRGTLFRSIYTTLDYCPYIYGGE
jgi:hypothetical protein